MMDLVEQYQNLAAHAQREAERAQNPADKEAWLRMRDGWQSLIQSRARPAPVQVMSKDTHLG
jgi:hypothetical protein